MIDIDYFLNLMKNWGEEDENKTDRIVGHSDAEPSGRGIKDTGTVWDLKEDVILWHRRD